MSVSESQTNVVYKMDDRTGPLVDVNSDWTIRSWGRSQVQVCMYMCVGVSVYIEVNGVSVDQYKEGVWR